jgi:hypothetical protein
MNVYVLTYEILLVKNCNIFRTGETFEIIQDLKNKSKFILDVLIISC